MAPSMKNENSSSVPIDHYSAVKSKLTAALPIIIQDLTCDFEDAPMVNERLKHALEYHVATKRLSRGISTAIAYNYFREDGITPQMEFLSYVAAWCIELVEIGLEIVDDMLDGSETRRGQESWYLVDNSGPLACNDAWMLQSGAYALLKKYFGKMSYYADLYNLFQEVIMKTLYGQALDVLTSTTKNGKTLTLEQYLITSKYRGCYQAVYLPIRVAMIISEVKEPEDLGQLRDICLELGLLFTIQDDYMDVYGQDNEIGSDIAEGKFSWILLAALQVATEDQRKLLQENYGRSDSHKVLRCKHLFSSMGIPKMFQIQERERMGKINSMLSFLPTEISREPFSEIMKIICANKF